MNHLHEHLLGDAQRDRVHRAASAAPVQRGVGRLANCRKHQRIIRRSALELDEHYVQIIERLVRVRYGWAQERIAGL
jgi:hypothetical protein